MCLNRVSVIHRFTHKKEGMKYVFFTLILAGVAVLMGAIIWFKIVDFFNVISAQMTRVVLQNANKKVHTLQRGLKSKSRHARINRLRESVNHPF